MFRKVTSYKTPGMQVYRPFEVLAEQPHVLIAGCTGSGKSVTLNGIITTVIATHSPATAQFAFIDPKRVELIQYAGLPHCIGYVTESSETQELLQFAVNETEHRYKTMQRNREKNYSGADLYIVIDELADIMITNKKGCLPLLQRIAAIGRAAKVHLIVCTQCVLVQFLPSSIRCNIPVTVALRTANKHESQLLINQAGCELLPDPKRTGTGYAIIRDGSDIEKTRIHKYADSMIDYLIEYWTSKRCIA